MGINVQDHAVATYINGMPRKKFEKTGLWVTRDRNGAAWLGVSPDGIVDSDIRLWKLSVLIWEEILFPIEKSQCCMFPNVNSKCTLLTHKNVTLFAGHQEKQ